VPDHENAQHSWTVLTPTIPADPPIMRLYGSPPMIDGEVPSSWVYRVAARHGWHPQEICQRLGWGKDLAFLDFTHSPPDIPTVAYITLNDVAVIASGFARSQLLLGKNTYYFMKHHADGLPLYRICARCLEEDPVPHIRAHWRLAYTVFCERHREALIDHCHACSSRISLNSRKHTYVPAWVRDRALCYCPTCRARLTDTKPAPVPPVLLPLLSNFQQLVYRAITRGYLHHPAGRISATTVLESFMVKERFTVRQNHGYAHLRQKYLAVDQINWESIIGVPHYEMFRKWLNGRVDSLSLPPGQARDWTETNDDADLVIYANEDRDTHD